MILNSRAVERHDVPRIVIRTLAFPTGKRLDEGFKVRQGGQRGLGCQAQLTSMSNALRVKVGAVPTGVGINTEPSGGVFGFRPHWSDGQGTSRERVVVGDVQDAGAGQVEAHFIGLWRVVNRTCWRF